MNELTVFKNDSFGEVRTLVINNEPYFVGKDVADILGYQNGSRDVNRHVEIEDRGTVAVHDGNQNREMTVINESGLYSLILSSKLPSAKQFKRWVTSEVLPSIRKHGAYMTEQTIEQALTSPDFLIRLATQLKDEQTKNKALEAKVEEQKPKVEFAEHVAAANNTMLVREVAKLASKDGIKIGERRMYEKLRAWGLIFKNSCEATQKAIERGLFEVTEGVRESCKGKFTYKTTRVTGKGQVYIISRLKEEQNKEMN